MLAAMLNYFKKVIVLMYYLHIDNNKKIRTFSNIIALNLIK